MNEIHHSILLAGVDPSFAGIARSLTENGYMVSLCADGGKALQISLERHPQLMIVDCALTTIPVTRLTQILRANPQSGEMPIIFIGDEGTEVDGFQRHRDHLLVRPLQFEQLLAVINAHFSRIEQARRIGRQQQEVEGSLDQMALVDLLQVFGLNRKSGTLNLRRGVERGSVYLDNGAVINASAGRVDGEKALYRLLKWEGGIFRFSPGQPQVEAKISAPIDHLLMEGLRILDEMNAQAATLPALNARLVLRIPRDRLPQGLRPATRDILLKLEYYPRVGDLLDQCPYPDFHVLQVLRVLREKGVISENQGDDLPAVIPFLSAAEILTAHQYLFGSGQLVEHATARILILTDSVEQADSFVALLHDIAEFEPTDNFLPAGGQLLPGDLGRLPLSESFALRFIRLPAQAQYQPLWPVFAHHLFGVLSLAPAGTLPEAEQYFSQIGRPIAYLDAQAPVGQSYPLKKGDRKGLAKLFTFFAAGFIEAPVAVEVS